MEKAIRLPKRLPNATPLAAIVGGIYWATCCGESNDELHRIADEQRHIINKRNSRAIFTSYLSARRASHTVLGLS